MAEQYQDDEEIRDQVEGEEPEDEDEDDDDSSDDDGDDEDEGSAGADDGDGGDDDGDGMSAEERRESRRQARRKARQRRKEKAQADKEKIRQLERQLESVSERLARTESGQTASDMARLDEAIGKAEANLVYAREQRKQALEEGDYDAADRLDDVIYSARADRDRLKAFKSNISRQVSSRQQPMAPQVSEATRRGAAEFMNKNPWYKADGGDQDSSIVNAIDDALAREGWDPNSREYWSELERRTRNYLPHRYEAEARRGSGTKSKIRVTGGGHSGGRRSSGVDVSGFGSTDIERAAVQQWREAGIWDTPERKKQLISAFRKANQSS